MTNYFYYKGECSLDYGLKVPELPPIVRPQRRTQKISVPGMNGNYTYNETDPFGREVYEPYIKSFDIATLNDEKLEDALDWLSGRGEITFSNELDKAYIADFYDIVPLARIFKTWRRGTVSCEVQPFKKDRYATEEVFTPVSAIAESRFRVSTQQNIPLFLTTEISDISADTVITLNGLSLTVEGFDSQVIQGNAHPLLTIDSERQTIYLENGYQMGQLSSGAFPLALIEGYNELTVSNTLETRVIYRGEYK